MTRAFVLSGGGSLGAMQVGALRALVERDILPDLIVGCSVGALNGSIFAARPGSEAVEKAANVWRSVTRSIVYPGRRLSVFLRIITGRDSLYDNRRFYAFLQASGCTPAQTFGDLRATRLFVTATHLRTGRLHVFGDDLNDRVLDALMASTALTPMHPPWEINGERYVDGGTVTPLPLRVALDRGATEIYALHLHKPNQEPPTSRVRGVAAHINQTVSTMLRLQAEHDLLLTETAKRVKLRYFTLWAPFELESTDFSRAEDLIKAGYTRAQELLDNEADLSSLPTTAPAHSWWQTLLGRWQVAPR
ncbi:MAG: patatin-like phospholipase family protein [Caldilineaceae bacterium]|nr:patatin-like phospholipase family protein [Caldilineaceae bacterium]